MKWKAYLDGELLGSNATQQNEEMHLLESTVSSEHNKTGSFSCKILPTHRLRDKIFKIRSQFLLLIDDDIEMKGRVMDTSDDIDGNLTINVEGSLAFFIDSVIEAYDEVSRTPKEQLLWIINTHNSQVEAYKHFMLGNVTVPGADNVEQFNNTSDQKSLDAITSGLINRFGGYIFVRYDGDYTYIDWLAKDSGEISNQKFSVGVNIKSLSRQVSPDDIFTVLKPVGADNLTIESVNNGSKYIRNEPAIEEFGIIIHSENFSNISNPSELFTKGTEYITKNYYGLTTTLSINAIDLHILDGDINRIRVGNRVTVFADPIGISETYTCSSVTLDLINPENSEYTLGTLKQSLTESYSSYKTETTQSISDTNSHVRGNSAAIAETKDSVGQLGKDLEVTARNVEVNAEKIAVNAREIDLKASSRDLERVNKTVYGDDEGDHGLVGQTADLFTNLKQVQIDLDGDEGTIGLKATSQRLAGDVDNLATTVSKQGERIDEAEILISNQGVSITAISQFTDGIYNSLVQAWSAITVNSSNISLKVGKGDELISEINASQDGILIRASKINLEGYVTASQLNAQVARIDNLLSGSAEISKLLVRNIDVLGRVTTSALNFYDHEVSWKSKNVLTSATLSKSTSTRTVQNSVGASISITYLDSDTALNTNSETIYYLGR